ncbi:DNA binding domain-containing protein, excisionase family [Cnuella takakiae]|uniref:DNA binding domain-containing protein, excisionase family n=1 Tax=Cnuella takakiae TaxID=1302690 RepID=A0A1M4S7X9_9BACT|nr:helix-turn-helix domain-containing protein [Cnuella takakiae]OLY94407.1 hypothetical protein BUE76_22890 [Cnuella takakiae]SHE28309.1 DNA binding domain-containing protein, excisionase family [Cnuella takakiae]
MSSIILSGVTLESLLLQIEQLLDAKIGMQHQTQKTEVSGYLSRKEVANLLKITLPTLHDYTKQGKLQAYKIGTRVLYKECEVKASLEGISSRKHKKGGVYHG